MSGRQVTTMTEGRPSPRTRVLGLLVALLGLMVLRDGLAAVRLWSAISVAFAVCGVIWIATGVAMMLCGLWTAALPWRLRIPRWIGGAAGALAGATVLVGVFTYVIPCSGPA